MILLATEFLRTTATRNIETLRVIGNADVFVTKFLRGDSHLLDRIRAVARLRLPSPAPYFQ
jgi:hypothetical protein